MVAVGPELAVQCLDVADFASDAGQQGQEQPCFGEQHLARYWSQAVGQFPHQIGPDVPLGLLVRGKHNLMQRLGFALRSPGFHDLSARRGEQHPDADAPSAIVLRLLAQRSGRLVSGQLHPAIVEQFNEPG